jgi:hypothetical protein
MSEHGCDRPHHDRRQTLATLLGAGLAGVVLSAPRQAWAFASLAPPPFAARPRGQCAHHPWTPAECFSAISIKPLVPSSFVRMTVGSRGMFVSELAMSDMPKRVVSKAA